MPAKIIVSAYPNSSIQICTLHFKTCRMKKIPVAGLFIAAALFFVAPSFAQTNPARQNPTVNHIAVYVYNLQKIAAFYHDIMQLDTIPEPFHDGRHVWFRIGAHTQLHLIQGAKAITVHDINSHICFAVPVLKEFMAHLNSKGIGYGNWNGKSKQVTLRSDGVQQIYFRDTEGNWIEVNDDKF